jgi:ribosome-binding protein aMBF1 (putative translation factor)
MVWSTLTSIPFVPIAVGAILLFAIRSYLNGYDKPAKRIIRDLNEISAGLRSFRGTLTSEQVDEIEQLFQNETLRSEWNEYRDSLHAFRDYDDSVIAIRATAPADFFFAKQSVVDTKINADFYRHLPGLLTGVGIIGTFTGLVIGLFQFDPNNPMQTLAPLLSEVTAAFVGSGLAIFAAIVVTWREKKIVNDCYSALETLNASLDRLFEEGVGEDYLYRLVSASEKNSANTAALKDALIEDLSKLMHEVADKQISAVSASNQNIAQTIGDAITKGLEGPMTDLMNVVKNASGSQGEAVTTLLENLLTAFMSKLDETFGQQIQSINSAIQRSSDSMLNVQQALSQLVTDISGAGQRAADEMSKKLEDAMTQASLAQSQMNQNLREFIQELKSLVMQQQSETKTALDEMLSQLLSDMKTHYNEANAERVQIAKENRERIEEISAGSKEIYAELTQSVNKLIGDLSTATLRTEENIRALQSVSTSAISGMNDGALMISQSADKFRSAGDSISAVFDKNSALTQKMGSMADAMELSASTLRTVISDHQQIKDQVLNLVTQLQILISSAQTESGVRRELVTEIQQALDVIRKIERESVEYLDKVNEALEESFTTFGEEMVGQVRALKGEADDMLTGSLSALSGAVEAMIVQVDNLKRKAE